LFFHLFTKKRDITPQAGFSLVELMVTIGIMTLVTGVLMVRYSSFNNVVILKSQAFELALDIREAQSYGVNSGGPSGGMREAYGIYIDTATPNTYILFQDTVGTPNVRYDVGEQLGETYVIDPRFTIAKICIKNGTSAETCGELNASIAFQRPNFDARIATDSGNPFDQLRVVLVSVADTTIEHSVFVYPSGQISVK